MTTAEPLVEPPTIPVADLEPMLADRERLCEMLDGDDEPCNESAVWALTFQDVCGCGDRPSTLLLACDECREQVERDCQAAQCLECLRYLPLLRAEPL